MAFNPCLQVGLQCGEYLQPFLHQRLPSGSFIHCHYFPAHLFITLSVQRVCGQHEKELPHHVAKKKIPYTDLATGEAIK